MACATPPPVPLFSHIRLSPQTHILLALGNRCLMGALTLPFCCSRLPSADPAVCDSRRAHRPWLAASSFHAAVPLCTHPRVPLLEATALITNYPRHIRLDQGPYGLGTLGVGQATPPPPNTLGACPSIRSYCPKNLGDALSLCFLCVSLLSSSITARAEPGRRVLRSRLSGLTGSLLHSLHSVTDSICYRPCLCFCL